MCRCKMVPADRSGSGDACNVTPSLRFRTSTADPLALPFPLDGCMALVRAFIALCTVNTKQLYLQKSGWQPGRRHL